MIMGEYINREEAIEAVKHAWAKGLEPSQYLEIIPAADVVQVRHGRWHDVYMSSPSSFTGTCSACGVSNDIPYPTNAHYCPNCGAMMDGGDE